VAPRLRKLFIWSAIAGALAAWRERQVKQNERRYSKPD
jgi:hypothetical protein